MPSQILITGATGFIGRRLARDLVQAGNSVRVLARSPRKARELFGETVEVTNGDLLDPASLKQACQGVDVVYHIAGIYRFGLRHRQLLWETNVGGTENLFQAAAQAGVGKVVHVSSGGILKGKGLLTEADYPGQAPPFSSYKGSKWHSEQLALAWAKKGFPITIASPTCPIGPEDEMPTPTGQIIRDFLGGRFPFYCRTGLNFVSVEDLSDGLQRAALHGRPGERYILGYQNLWLKQFLDILAEETGLRSPRFALPQWVVWAAGLGGEAAGWLGSGECDTRICLETALQSSRVQFFDNAKARNELGWEPSRPVRQSVREAIAWSRGAAAMAEAATPAAAAPSAETHVG